MNNVWQLENQKQIDASDDLNILITQALNGKRSSLNYLKTLWPECNWQEIKNKLNTEGSVWYVWYMDGVNQHIANLRKEQIAKQIAKRNENLKGLYNLSPLAKEPYEPYFSACGCEICGSELAGNRYEIIGIKGKKHTDPKEVLSVCTDCYLYLFT